MEQHGRVERKDVLERNGYCVEPMIIQRDGFPIPALLFVPHHVDSGKSPALMLDSRGMAQTANDEDGPVLRRVRNGRGVLSTSAGDKG